MRMRMRRINDDDNTGTYTFPPEKRSCQGPDQLQELVMKMMMVLRASVDDNDYEYDCLVFMAIMKIMLVWYQQ